MTSSTSPPSQHTMEDPDRDWKPNNRPQSTIARNFMSELDDLFRLDGGIDLLDKTVHQKKQAVTTHSQELEALEAKLRETEERLKQVKTSPPRRKDSQRRSPIEGVFPADADAWSRTGDDDADATGPGSPSPGPQKDVNMPERPSALHAETDADKA